MAKEQALPISADGLAGPCGRLRCCPRFEYERYREVNRALPRIGEEVGTPDGLAKVIVGHRLKETVSVRYDDDRVLEWTLAQLERLLNSKNQSTGNAKGVSSTSGVGSRRARATFS